MLCLDHVLPFRRHHFPNKLQYRVRVYLPAVTFGRQSQPLNMYQGNASLACILVV
jgi:hypothetical protein